MQAGPRAAIVVFVHGCVGGARDRARVRAGRPRGSLEFPQQPHGARCAAAGAGDQSGSPEADTGAATRARLERADRDQSELLHHRLDHGPGAVQAVRHRQDYYHHAAGRFGAGYPGVASMDIMGNVVPFIGCEEEKMQQETQKIMGEFRGDHIEPLAAKVSAHCNRVAVVDGHTVTVSVEFSSKPSEADLRHAIDSFTALPQQRELPSAPPRPVIYMPEADRPQPRQDAERERGMAAFVGRLRPCTVLDYKFVAMAHNTVRGAAGAAVLNAELMHSEGMLD